MDLKTTARRSAFLSTALATLLLAIFVVPGRISAQEEGEPVVVDEVIAQVNNDVITLSMVKREMKEAAEQLRARNNTMTEQEADAKVATMQNEIIVGLVNEQLLVQKGKDANLTDEVEQEVNRRLLQIAAEQNIKTIAELEAAMTASGLNPADVRQTMRTEMMKNMVYNNEVDRRVYFSLGAEDLKKYYEANKEKFRKPESMELSEIFLSLAGKPEAEVRGRAAQIVAQARAANADFGALAVANSEREQNGVRVAPQSKGKLGRIQMTDISQKDVAAGLKDLPKGGVTDPIKLDEGLLILHVDDRTTGSEPVYDENRVREVMTMERAPKERETFMQTLRDEAFIKIAKDYQNRLEPLLAPKKVAAAANAPAADDAVSSKKPQQPNSSKQRP
ncbi:MAG TPA: peptidyl-prolyl cis-trans isomerase [Pyrinomonadaceae bacterium]|nr:peptidyl-prolyl cis-trans isomerase [Pyrinomonadaceae bacterium]